MPRHISDVDRFVAQRVRLARVSRHLSQTELADTLGVTFQQVQKYENGSNRVSAGSVFRIAAVLGVHVPLSRQRMKLSAAGQRRGMTRLRGRMNSCQIDRELPHQVHMVVSEMGFGCDWT